MSVSFEELCSDVWLNILPFLSPKEFVSLQKISKYFGDITDESKHGSIKNYWKKQSKHLFCAINTIYNITFNDLFDATSWYHFYLATRTLHTHTISTAAAIIKAQMVAIKKWGTGDYFKNYKPDWIIAACDIDSVLIFQMMIFDDPTKMVNIKRKPNIELELHGEYDYSFKNHRDLVSLFWHCCQQGSINIIKYLVNNKNIFKCIPNQMIQGQGEHGYTPLCVACLYSQESVARFLFNYLKIKDDTSVTVYTSNVLHCAVWASDHDKSQLKSKLNILAMLLDDENIDVNFQMYFDGIQSITTPLLLAIRDGRTDVVDLVLSNKRIDINAVVPGDKTAIGTAIELKRKQIVKDLFKREDLDTNNPTIVNQIKNGVKSTDYSIEKICEEFLYKMNKKKKINQPK